MNLQDIYTWEIETLTGQIYSQFDKKGVEQNWKSIAEEIARVSLISKIFPSHHCLIDVNKGDSFKRRFGRGILKPSKGGLSEYLHCIVTDKYRMWVKSTSGQVFITHRDYEIYL